MRTYLHPTLAIFWVLLVISCIIELAGSTSIAHAQEWVGHLEWCRNNDTGSEPCDDRIAGHAPNCALSGKHPKCLYDTAKDSAVHNNCDRAFEVVKLCQCHNEHAESTINDAGKQVICNYLVSH